MSQPIRRSVPLTLPITALALVSLAACTTPPPGSPPQMTAQQKLEGPIPVPREGGGSDTAATTMQGANRQFGL